MSDKKSMRRHLFVDPKVQGALVGRVALYWFASLVTLTMMLVCWRVLAGSTRVFALNSGEMWLYYGPAVLASFVLLPLVLIDMVRLSNRFAGPMLRLRRSMRAVARGERVEPIRFRDGDFWHEFARDFNAMLEQVQGESAPEDTEEMPQETPSLVSTS